jgi:dihydroorotase
METLTIVRPDDWHVHFRDGQILQHTVPASARHFSRALIMPNLKPALTSVDAVLAYRKRILSVLDNDQTFTPYMTLFLNESIDPNDFAKIKAYPCILGGKLYPAGATTNSEEGARSLRTLYPLLEIMQQENLVLQIHGEVTVGDIFQREAEFIKTCLIPLIQDFPKLRVVLEHISTQEAVDFVMQAEDRVAATITPHHLLYNRNQLLAGGIRPHYYCLPILKRESDQRALQQAAISGNPKFFAGTDSAPHAKINKESACGCAGIYSAPFAVAMYAQVFDELGQLNRLNDFLACFGSEFYQLPLNQTELILRKKSQLIPRLLPLGDDQVVPVAAGEVLQWSIYEPT